MSDGIPCPDGCPRVYQSLKAAMLCQCDKYDKYGHEHEKDAQ